jgi:hypothetical protein
MPAMMSVRQPMRKASADSPNISMPAIMLPAAPIPVHSAYAVPNGTDLREYPSSAKLEAIANSIPTVGQNLVNPSDDLRVNAHTTSSKPARRMASHAVMTLAAATASAHIRHNGAVPGEAKQIAWFRMIRFGHTLAEKDVIPVTAGCIGLERVPIGPNRKHALDSLFESIPLRKTFSENAYRVR